MSQQPQLNFIVLTSHEFWVGAPLIMAEVLRRGHYLSALDDSMVPSPQSLLACDVLIDMSSITDENFYRSLDQLLQVRARKGIENPVLVDPPKAVLSSVNKEKTNELFRDLVPESYLINGENNEEVFRTFSDEGKFVLKPCDGWGGKGVSLISIEEARESYLSVRGMIAQRYIPPTQGIGRALTLCSEEDVELICAYRRIPETWRTGTDVAYRCVPEEVSQQLREFARDVSVRSGLYLNGIDYIFHNGSFVLLEVNAVPAIKEPQELFGIDIPAMILDHIERTALRRKTKSGAL